MDKVKQSIEKKPCTFIIVRSYVGKRSFSDVVTALMFSAYDKFDAENRNRKTG